MDMYIETLLLANKQMADTIDKLREENFKQRAITELCYNHLSPEERNRVDRKIYALDLSNVTLRKG